MTPIEEIYERFKHLDTFLSDEMKYEQAAKECSSSMYMISGDFWRAIKKELEQRGYIHA
jgi:hypothetical protein